MVKKGGQAEALSYAGGSLQVSGGLLQRVDEWRDGGGTGLGKAVDGFANVFTSSRCEVAMHEARVKHAFSVREHGWVCGPGALPQAVMRSGFQPVAHLLSRRSACRRTSARRWTKKEWKNALSGLK